MVKVPPIDRQQYIIDRVVAGDNIFITGLGGSGKSYTVNRIMNLWPNETALCAPTGVAALNIKGMTAHRMFGLPVGLPTESDKYSVNRTMRSLFSNNVIKKVIIDEVGMLRADYLDIINTKLQSIKRNSLPFGGLQMIVVGDFFQLDPIVAQNENEYYYDNYESVFCFTSKSWDFRTIELEKSYRQEDERQVKILNSIRRKDRHYKLALQRIKEECKRYDINEDILHLCCYKKDAERVNDRWYNKITNPEEIYIAKFSGNWVETPVEEELKLKVGCRIIICANCPEGGYVNGDRGEVLKLSTSEVLVKLVNGTNVWVSPNKWEKFKYSTTKGVLSKKIDSYFEQLPLRLGYGITIHKSQGCTLDDVVLDFGRGCFTHGQAYVALSRIRNIKNIRLMKPIKPTNIICRQEVIKFYEDI